MQPFEHFGLKRPPFEMKPDPRFFLKSPSHMEVLATLQYTIYASKACSVVVGESGSGKTLLARVISNACNRRADILWVDAIGQPAERTEATLYSSRTADEGGSPAETELILADWARSNRRLRSTALLIVDDADVLSPQGWQDILLLLTSNARAAKPVNILLFGLTGLLDTLSAHDMVRIRRRIFRTCTLSLLDRQQTGAYIQCRIAAAGRADSELFNEEAIDSIHRVSGGNPALINQLCDNAMVSAFSDGHTAIDVAHIMTSVRSTLFVRRPLLAQPAAGPRRLLLESGSAILESRTTALHASDESFDADDATKPCDEGRPVRVVENIEVKSSPPGHESSTRPGRRLEALEARVMRALAVVRHARTLTDGIRTANAADRTETQVRSIHRPIVEGLDGRTHAVSAGGTQTA